MAVYNKGTFPASDSLRFLLYDPARSLVQGCRIPSMLTRLASNRLVAPEVAQGALLCPLRRTPYHHERPSEQGAP